MEISFEFLVEFLKEGQCGEIDPVDLLVADYFDVLDPGMEELKGLLLGLLFAFLFLLVELFIGLVFLGENGVFGEIKGGALHHLEEGKAEFEHGFAQVAEIGNEFEVGVGGLSLEIIQGNQELIQFLIDLVGQTLLLSLVVVLKDVDQDKGIEGVLDDHFVLFGLLAVKVDGLRVRLEQLHCVVQLFLLLEDPVDAR